MSRVDLAPDIADALADRDAEGRTRALRALLRRPVLRAQADGEVFRLARRHAEALRAWFDKETGWRLDVESQTVRLRTSYVPHGPTAVAVAERHPARARRGDPGFTRRRYVLLCLALAVLERSDPQISLGRLADQIVLLAQQPGLAAIEFTMTGREQRSDLVAAIRLLLGYGVLVRVAGDEEAYVSSSEGDALYDVDRRVLGTMLSAEHAPGLAASALGAAPAIGDVEAALHAPPPAYTEDEVNLRLRHALTRRLLCDPVVYYDELPGDERDYLRRQRVGLTGRIAAATGLVPEMRAEGIAMVDPDDQLTDLRMPEQGTEGHATLLLAEHLVTEGPADVPALRRKMRRLAQEHGSYWRKASRDPGAEKALVAEALERLAGLGLVCIDTTGPDVVVHPLPALRRFAVTAPTIRERKKSR
ncbi:hypothetical protein GCM10027059_45450 [Myceligenerans halotolerans]